MTGVICFMKQCIFYKKGVYLSGCERDFIHITNEEGNCVDFKEKPKEVKE